MVVRGGKRHSTDDMPSCIPYITKEHFVFLKQTLTYLAVSIIWGRGEQGSGPAGRQVEGGTGGRVR